MKNLYYPPHRLNEILAAQMEFQDADQKLACENILDQLSKEDVITVAKSSYAYWYSSITANNRDVKTSSYACPAAARGAALHECRRHLVGEDWDEDRALASIQVSIEARKEYNVDVLRLCFVANRDEYFVSEQDQQLCEEYRTLILEDLPKQLLVIRGKDHASRPIVSILGRTTPETNPDGYVLTRLYLAERATAASEYLSSVSSDNKIVAVFQTENYQSSNAPPFAAIKKCVTLLQSMYPERLKACIILDPPFWLRSLFSVIKFFMNAESQSKIMLAKGEQEKEQVFGNMMDKSQAMPFMIEGGELTSPIDFHHFLQEVPFHCLYDDEECIKGE